MTCNYELLPMNNNRNMARYFPIPSPSSPLVHFKCTIQQSVIGWFNIYAIIHIAVDSE